jgi:response regulator RpfG family c-di-GMP phosphodiesterase
MRERSESASPTQAKLLRIDAGHTTLSPHERPAVLNRRRVRQVLSSLDATPAKRRLERGAEHSERAATLPLPTVGRTPAPEPQPAVDQMVQRFRNSFSTLSDIARDPLVWNIEERALLTDLRETLLLTESALLQIETTASNPACKQVAAEGVLALAQVIDQRVDDLFDRMERLTALKQRVFRFSVILEGLLLGRRPLAEEIETLAEELLAIAPEDQSITLVYTESDDQALRIAAHSVNVAQVTGWLAWQDPAWQQECVLAATAALLQDLGMVQVPPEVFCSRQRFTTPQRTLVQQHTGTSAAIVEHMRGHDDRLVAAVYQHHERLDGSGYPDHCRAESISSVARLLAVADTYVGMQSPRPYRHALAPVQVLREMERAATEGRLDLAWTRRLPSASPQWLVIPEVPQPPSGAPSLSALAA